MNDRPDHDPGAPFRGARRVFQVLLVPMAAWAGVALHRPPAVVVLAVAVVAISPLTLILPAGAKSWLGRHVRPLTALWFFGFTTGVGALLSGLPVWVCALIALPSAVVGFVRSRRHGQAVGRLPVRSRPMADPYDSSFWDSEPSERR